MSTSQETSTQRDRRIVYIVITVVVVVLLLVICAVLLQLGARQTKQAQDKADQLIAALRRPG